MKIDGVSLLLKDYDGNADGTKPADTAAITAKVKALGQSVDETVALAVEDDPDFILKSPWERYIDQKIEAANLSATEKARSFIFITDNHDYEHNSGRDVGLRTALIDYTRKQLGFKTVIHGGDVYDQFCVKDDRNDDRALEVYQRYVNDELYGTFGTDLLFAAGNHDGNLLGWREAIKENGTNYVENAKPEDYLFSEDLMYDTSIANLGNKVQYDEDGIAAIQLTMEYYGVKDQKTIDAGIGMIKMHYYWDDTDNKTRYIILDTGANGLISVDFLEMQYTNYMPAQLKWFAETLYDVKTNHPDFNVVIAGHQMSADSSAEEIAANDNWVHRDFYEIMSAFKSGGTYKITTTSPWMAGTYDDDSDGTADRWQNPSLLVFLDYLDGKRDWDLSNIGAFTSTVAEFDFGSETYKKTILTIAGHCHADNAYYKNNFASGISASDRPLSDNALTYEGTLNSRAILYITTGTSVYSHIGSATIDQASYGYKMSNTLPDKLRFDVVTIMDDGSVRLTRIGYGEDRVIDSYLPNK